jgi:hypothetical protein
MKEAGRDNHVTAMAGNPLKKQRTLLGGYKITDEKHDELDHMLAMALYMGGLAFRTFSAVWIRRFLVKLSWETWTPLPLKEYVTTLLNIAYLRVKATVNKTLYSIVESSAKLYFILDESTDRRSRRMINLSAVLKPFSSFFLTNKDSKDAKLGGAYFLNWFKAETKVYTKGILKNIRSMTTDTYATMRLF